MSYFSKLRDSVPSPRAHTQARLHRSVGGQAAASANADSNSPGMPGIGTMGISIAEDPGLGPTPASPAPTPDPAPAVPNDPPDPGPVGMNDPGPSDPGQGEGEGEGDGGDGGDA